MFRLLTVGVLTGALLLAGCRVDTRPKVAVRHDVGGQPRLRKAPHPGIFRLYLLPPSGTSSAGASATTRPAGRELLVESTLRRGERVGFARNAQGQLVAIAGDGTPLLLQEGRSYLWQMQAEPGHDHRNTAALIVIVVGVVVVIVVAIVGSWYEFNPL